jgi:DNA-binding NarL/FixJ family response regulator
MLRFFHRPFPHPEPLMPKYSKKSRRQEPPAPLAEPVPRIATRRATADRKLRILEQLTSGLSVGHIARVEQLTVQRVRRIIAEMMEKREAYQHDMLV